VRFNIISNLVNGVGLQQDYLLLKSELERRGHSVTGLQGDDKHAVPAPADINIFIEWVVPRYFSAAPRQWLIPNPDWFYVEWRSLLPRFERILAKTRDCERIFRSTNRCSYLGWRSRDLLDASVTRSRKFLHVAGKSQLKNTPSIIEAWRRGLVDADLTVISAHYCAPSLNRVTIVRRASDSQLQHNMNSHLFHLMPSAYEGWGHALHEALGVGAVLLTTDAPPMNELKAAAHFITADGTSRFNTADLRQVNFPEIASAVNEVLSWSSDKLSSASSVARQGFQEETTAFQERLDELIRSAA